MVWHPALFADGALKQETAAERQESATNRPSLDAGGPGRDPRGRVVLTKKREAFQTEPAGVVHFSPLEMVQFSPFKLVHFLTVDDTEYPYQFDSVDQLIADFGADVERVKRIRRRSQP